MKIVLVYRPELCDTDGDHQPFEGIEILGVANNDDEANELIERIRDEHLGEQHMAAILADPNYDWEGKHWKYHIDTV
jgi:hypothetical protein